MIVTDPHIQALCRLNAGAAFHSSEADRFEASISQREYHRKQAAEFRVAWRELRQRGFSVAEARENDE